MMSHTMVEGSSGSPNIKFKNLRLTSLYIVIILFCRVTSTVHIPSHSCIGLILYIFFTVLVDINVRALLPLT